jgi:LAO/AO transport system kinase
MVRDAVLDRVTSSATVRANRHDLERRVRDGELTPALAAQEILHMVDQRLGEPPG